MESESDSESSLQRQHESLLEADEDEKPPPAQLYRCGHCEAMFEEMDDAEAHINLCTGNQEEEESSEGFQCQLCWANGEMMIVTTVEDFQAHMSEVHRSESVPEVADNTEIMGDGGVMDRENGLIDQGVAEDVDSIKSNLVSGIEDTVYPEIDVPLNNVDPIPDVNSNFSAKPTAVHKCDICQHCFTSEILMEEHKKEHPSCPICFTKLLSRAHYKEHVKEHPNCEHCGVKVANAVELENHMFEHVLAGIKGRAAEEQTPKRKIAIDQCRPQKISQRMANIQSTEEKVASSNSRDVKSLHTVLSLANPELEVEMVSQMPEQHPSEEDQVVVTCPTIDDGLKAHVNFIGREEVHPLELGSSSGLFELSVKCQFCADTFSSMEDLSAHISVLHTDVEEDPSNRVKVGAGLDKKQVRPREQYISANPPFFCNVCPDKREFEKVLHLKRHVDKVHPVELRAGVQFQCQMCSHPAFMQLETLQRHMGIEHNDVSKHRYVCPLCEWTCEGLGREKGPKAGEGARKLRDHLRRHDLVNPRPYGCSICTGTFVVNNVLFVHTKNCKGIPPKDPSSKDPKPAVSITLNPENEGLTFRCVKCTTNFTSHEVFESHACNLKTNDINKFHCAQCGNSFEGSREFKRHIAICDRNSKQQMGSFKKRGRKRKVEAKPEIVEIQLQVDGSQIWTDHNLNNLDGFNLEESLLGPKVDDLATLQGFESHTATEQQTEGIEASFWVCKACQLQCVDQVQLANHYHESAKCRELLASNSAEMQNLASQEHLQTVDGEFHCLPCGYSTKLRNNYHKHLKTQRHQTCLAESRGEKPATKVEWEQMMAIRHQNFKPEEEEGRMQGVVTPSMSGMYQCLPCEYVGKNVKHYNQHLRSKKHKSLVKEVRCQSSGEEEYKETKTQALKRAPTVTSSGRKVIPKRFIGEDDDSDGREKVSRKRRRVGSVVKRESSHNVPKVRGIVKRKEDQHEVVQGDVAPPREWTCQFCFAVSWSPEQFFLHLASHVPAEVKDCAGMQPDQGWCPFCPGPVGLSRATSHLALVHPDE